LTAVIDGGRMKTKLLTVYDYGMGAIWRYIYARRAEEIADKYPGLEVLEQEPDSRCRHQRSAKQIFESHDGQGRRQIIIDDLPPPRIVASPA
jgi:hypothetical protein